MLRQKIVAGNWKMNKCHDEGIALASEICGAVKKGIHTRTGADPLVVIAPPYYLLSEIASATAGIPGIAVAAQNAASEASGAYTGEVSAPMIASTGATHVIIGHSERRALFAEDDALLRRKAEQVIDAGLNLIFCVGEVLQERLENRHFEIVVRQIDAGLFHFEHAVFNKIIIAYEPVWAIGTGQHASPEQAEEMHAFIRKQIVLKYGAQVAEAIPILYGGSCKPDNASQLFVMPNVDGGLIGGASLKASDFIGIIQAI